MKTLSWLNIPWWWRAPLSKCLRSGAKCWGSPVFGDIKTKDFIILAFRWTGRRAEGKSAVTYMKSHLSEETFEYCFWNVTHQLSGFQGLHQKRLARKTSQMCLARTKSKSWVYKLQSKELYLLIKMQKWKPQCYFNQDLLHIYMSTSRTVCCTPARVFLHLVIAFTNQLQPFAFFQKSSLLVQPELSECGLGTLVVCIVKVLWLWIPKDSST